MGKDIYIINKIPLQERPEDIPVGFPRQPQLYLELIENKKKIKPELVNKDYVPPTDVQLETAQSSPRWRSPRYNTPASVKSAPISEPEPEAPRKESSGATGIREQLFKKGTPFSEKYTTPLTPTPPKRSTVNATGARLPTLTELESRNKIQRQKEFVDVGKIKEDDDNTKREILFKLDILRKSYPKATIESYTIHDKLSVIKDYYDSKLKMLSLENSVENYKTYLTFLFMGVEALFGKVFKLDMKGFTEQQLVDYHKYEKLLIEIGEKSHTPDNKKWPVWLRLLFLVIVQTAFFVVGKMILGGAASKILSAVSDMKAAGAGGPSGAKPMRKMRGPRINLDEIPDRSGAQHRDSVPS